VTRASTIAVAAGALGGLLLVAALRQSTIGMMVGAMLSPLPLAMVVFGLGNAFLPVAVVAGAVAVAVMTGSFAWSAVYLAVDAAPIAVLSRMGLAALSEGKPVSGIAVGRTVCLLVTVAVAAVIVGLAAMSAGPAGAEAGGIEAALRTEFEKRLPPMAADADANAAGGVDIAAMREQIVQMVAKVLPGATGWQWCLRAILSAGLAQVLLTRMNLAAWPTPAYREFAAPQWFFALFGAAGLAAVALTGDAGFIASNAAAILSLPLILQGLAVVHTAAARVKYRLAWLVVFYVAGLVMAAFFLVMLVALSVMDHFLQIRARYLSPRTGGE